MFWYADTYGTYTAIRYNYSVIVRSTVVNT